MAEKRLPLLTAATPTAIIMQCGSIQNGIHTSSIATMEVCTLRMTTAKTGSRRTHRLWDSFIQFVLIWQHLTMCMEDYRTTECGGDHQPAIHPTNHGFSKDRMISKYYM